MATQQILIEYFGKDVSATKASKQVETSVAAVGKQSVKTTATMTKGFESVETQLNRMGNKFRFMSIAFTMLAAGAVVMGKSFITAAREVEQSQLKLGVFAASAGEDFDEVTAAAMKLYSTGLIPLQDASEGLANLLATGLGLEKSVKLMDTFLNSAVVAKESLTDTFGRAIVKATLGVRIFQERQIDAIGINTRLDMVFRDYAKTIGVVSTELTNTQKYQAIYNFYMKEGERYTGAAQLATETFSGSLSRLGSSFKMMQASLGATLIPLIGTLADSFVSVTRHVANIATAFPGLTSAVITGSIAFSVLAASLAAVGAVIPLVAQGLKVLGFTTITTMLPVLGMLALKFAAISLAIGAVGYAILKVTGKWDKWTNSMKNLASRIAEIIQPMAEVNDEIEENNKKLAESLETLERNIKTSTRDFNEDMAAWAQKHDSTVTDLRQQISALERDYKKSTGNITDDFNDMMSDISLSHARKTEDLQREIAEEVSKGIWADQARINDLQRSLDRENEDYALSVDEKQKKRKDDMAEEKSEYSEKLTKLQDELNKELALEEKHAALVSWARTQYLPDELEKRTRAFSERLDQYNRELLKLQETSAAEMALHTAVGENADDATSKIETRIEAIQRLGDEVDILRKKADNLNTIGGTVAATIKGIPEALTNNPVVDKLSSHFQKLEDPTFAPKIYEKGGLDVFLVEKTTDAIQAVMGGIKNFTKNLTEGLFSFQTGGIVPGSSSQAVPIIAHGGETVLPAGVAPVTININNPSVRSDADIRSIATAVQDILSTQQRFRHIT